jgi:hypothetical protein
MKLQERDFAVLAALERWGVMGLGQLDGMLFHKEVIAEERARLFFNEVRREDYWGRAYKRLSGLEKLGLVRVRRFPYSWPVYMLTGQGFELLQRRGKTRFDAPKQGVSDRLVRHEVAVVGVGLVLTQVLGCPVNTARETWGWMSKQYGRDNQKARLTMPDLLTENAGGKMEHIVEVELTPKSKKRYRDIFDSHARRLPNHQTSKILYLVDWPGGVGQITGLGHKYETSSVYAASLSTFRATLGRCEFAPSYPRNYAPFTLTAKSERTPEAPRGAEQEVSR